MKITKSNVQHITELNALQKGILFDSLKHEDFSLYNTQIVLEINGELNLDLLQNALCETQKCNDILRSIFDWEKTSKPLQIILKEVALDYEVITISKNNDAQIFHYLDKERKLGFNLNEGCPVRVRLLKKTTAQYLLVITHHTILYDGWSNAIFLKDIFSSYHKLQQGKETNERVQKVQYKAYLNQLQNQHIKNSDVFWKTYLEEYTPGILSKTSAGNDNNGTAREKLILPIEGLVNFCKKENITKASLIYVAYGLLLQKYLDSDDVLYGTPVSTRNSLLPGASEIMGNFVNTLPLRFRNTSNESLIDIIKRTDKELLNRNEHNNSSLDQVKTLVESGKENELFNTILAIENYPVDQTAININKEFTIQLYATYESVEAPLLVQIFFNTSLEITVQYATNYFSKEYIQRLLNHFKNCIHQLLSNSSLKKKDLHILDTDEQQELLLKSNGPKVEFSGTTILEKFDEIVNLHGYRKAVSFEGIELSYQELDEKSTQLAKKIRLENAFSEDKLIPICLKRSEKMILAILGVLKAGCAYVPVDPDYPVERKKYILHDINAKKVITTLDYENEFSDYGYETIILDTENTSHLIDTEESKLPKVVSNDTIYVIYTSGTTGKPKGVVNTHQGLHNKMMWMLDYLSVNEFDVVLQKTTYCFDVSFWEFFLPLLAGGTLVLAKPEGEKDSEYLANIINEKEITITHFVPSMLNAFLLSDAIGKLKKLRAVVCSGEALKPATVQHFKKVLPKVELHNLYGPTEAGIEVTTQNLSHYHGHIIPIGKPVANTQMYIVDREHKLQPIGITGDLLIGGIQVAEGYRNLPLLTQEKFQKDPFKTENRIYKTGDKARWLPDGTIEFLGRADSQIKLRGYRIEIEEIESVLEQIPELYQSTVQLQDIYGNQHLVCYYALHKNALIEEETIQENLRAYLPEYMIPGFYKQLDVFPVTSNGKLDRKKLPLITIEKDESIVLPATADEKKMLTVWTSLLGVESISVKQSFFVLGGDSIKAIQLMSRCKAVGLHFKIKDVLNYPTIRSLCKNLITETTVISESGKLQASFELLSIQKEFLLSNPHTPQYYNQSALVSLSKKISSDQIKNAVQQLMEHHDMLRALFIKNDDEYTAYYGPLKNNFFYTQQKGESSLKSICLKYESSLQLEESLCKFIHIIDEEAEENKLFIVAHHLVIDGVSWRILLEDLENILVHETQGKSFVLPQKQTSFRQWTNKLKQYSEKIFHSSELSYWLKLYNQFQLENAGKETIPTTQFGKMEEYRLQLNALETSALLQNIHTTFGTNINDVLVSALVVAMNEGFNLEHFYIALEGHGREDLFPDVDISRTVGWFTSLYPVRLQYHKKLNDVLVETKDVLRDIPTKGIGYGLLSTLYKDAQVREKLSSIKPSVLFNYLGSFDEIVKPESLFSYVMDTRQIDVSPNNTVAHNLAINSMVLNGMLDISISYNPTCYTNEEIQFFANNYHQAITQIIKLCNASETSAESSRSDYGLPATVKNNTLKVFKNKLHAQHGKIETIYALSALQEGMLFHALLNESATAYVSEFSFDITAGFDKNIFEKSWNYLAKHHEILRAGIYANDLAIPVQCIYEEVALNITELDCRALSETEINSKLSQLGKVGLKLETPPLFKIALVRISDDITRFILHYHHILWDGWSLSILMDQFLKVYNNLYAANELPVIKGSSYRAHVEQIKKYQKYDTSKYWKEYLKNSTEETYIPFIKKPLERNKTVANTTQKFSLGEKTTKLILKYAKENQVTVNTIIQGCWGYLLHKYTGQKQVTFGAITSGRNASIDNTEVAVGLYINTLPVVVDCKGEPFISNWLSKLQQEHTFAREEYGHDSLVRINQYLNKSESLFDSLLVFENYPVDTSVLNKSNLKIQNLQSKEYTNYVLTLEVITQENDIEFNINYHNELLDHHIVSMIEKHMLRVLNLLCKENITTISDIELLGNEEKHEILKLSTGAKIDYGNATVLDIFKNTVAKKGDGIALRYEGATMSYKELDVLSDDLAGYLIDKGILDEDKLVPISLDRGFMMVVGILGILKSGGAYVPIDPLYPASRKHYILKDIAAKTIITTSDYREEYSDLGYDVLNLDTKENYQTNDKITLATVTPEDTIYVLYTSGSTGVPKGVINTHKGLYNRLLWMRDSLCLDEKDVILQKTTFCFDVSFWELILPLLIGAEMVLARAGGEKDSEYLSKIIEEEGITLLHFVPSMLAAFLSDVNSSFKNLRSVVCSGEALPESVVSLFKDKMGATELYNLYGPTEAAIDVTAINLSHYKGSGVPIGKPVNNTDIYIVNDTNELQPIGVKGELCIGGVQVSKGYLHNETLTAEKYINNPYGEGCLYRTGDLARWDADGNIEYLGREDSQIKLRGYRIELGEITRVLENYPNIAQAVVIKGEIGTSEHLLCYYRSDSETIDENKLKAHLSGQLPNYMVPSYYKQLEHFALTSNGKLDRKQLPEITITNTEGHQAAQTKDEKAMVAIWEGLLGISSIGINTNFFELGGDSIKAIQLMSRSKQQGYHFKVKDVFKHPTIGGLLSVCGESETLLIETGVLEGDFELLPIQHRFIEHNHQAPNHYNQSVLLSIPKDFSNDILKSSIKKLVEHHDILRSSYKDGKGYYQQEITEYYKEETASDDNQLTKYCQEYQESFDIANGPLIRFIKISYPSDTKDRLFIVAHHLVIDGVSWRIILEDLEHLLSNQNYTLPEKQSSLRQWSKGLSDYTVSLSEGVKEYWQEISKDYKLLKDLNNNPLSGKLETHSNTLNKEITKSLSQEIHGKYGTELQDVLLSCLSQVLGSHYNSSQIYIDLEGHGREEIISGLDISRTIGWFTSLYPLKLQVSETIGVQLRDTKDMLKEVPDGGLSYGALRYLSDNPQKYEYSKGGILFNYLGDFSSTVAEEGLLGFAGESTGDNIHPSNSEGYGLLLTFMIAGGELQMNWSYDEGMYSESEIATLSALYQTALTEVIADCKDTTARILSCSDCGLPSSVGNIALDEFIKTCETNNGAIESVYRLSPLQEGMLFHSLYGGEGSGSYVSEFVCDFNGGINYDVFVKVWKSIVARHGILRTGIYSEGLSHAVQCVYKSVDLPITHYNYTDKDEKWLSNYFADKALVSFDMESAPLFSFELYDLPGGITRLYLYNHHILWDGWSLSILMNEFIQGYDTVLEGTTIEQGYVSDYGAYVRDLYDRDRSGEGINYWQEYLSGVEGGVYLPFLKDTSLRNSVFGDSHVSFELDTNHTNLLVKYSQTHGLTMNTLVQGAWSYLLHSYTGAEKIVFGATVSGRDWSVGSVEQEVGLYINTLPVSIEVDRDQDLGDWLSDLQAGHSKGREQYSHVSLSMIQEAMGVNEALFDSLIVFENYPVDEELLSTSSLNMVDMYSNEYTNYALTIGVSHTGDRLHFKLDYNKEVFPQAYIDLIVAHLQNVLHSIGKATEKVGALAYIDESENVLQLGKGNTIAIEDATTIVSLFEDQVKKVPDNIAAIYNGQAVTYAALNARSNQLARYLQANHNVGKDTVVAIQMEKSLDYLISILAVLKSGSCYLPVDIDHPATRKEYMLNDSNAVLILSTTAHATDTSLSEIPVVTIDTVSLDTYPKENLDITIERTDLAYIIYTSGSTGVPKGVMIEHKGNVNMSLDQVRIFGVTATDVVVWFAAVGFDASVSEIMMALYSGATLAIPQSGVIKDKDRFVNFLQKTNASVVTFPPSYVSLLSLEEIEGIRVVITAGEAAQGSKAYEIAASGKAYYNAYGPTECSVCVSVYKYDYQDGIVQNVPIGSAIANTRLYVLNEDLQKVATGVWGELCVSGVGLSRGYIGKESLTAEKFIANPYEAGQKIYRTGDVCRWNTSGELEFKGRKDTQVKLRGYRIELGEIESIVNLQEGINQSIVIIHGEGEVQDLACYVVLNKNISLDIEKLKASLTEALPEYMVPTHYMELEELPLTINGKVDKKRLPAITYKTENYVAPSTEIEYKLVKLWSQVLGIEAEAISITKSFFELGGHSIKAMRLFILIKQQFEITITLQKLYNYVSVKSMSKYIELLTVEADQDEYLEFEI